MLFRGVFSQTLKTSWKALPGFCVVEERTGLNAEKKKRPVGGKCHKTGTGDDRKKR